MPSQQSLDKQMGKAAAETQSLLEPSPETSFSGMPAQPGITQGDINPLMLSAKEVKKLNESEDGKKITDWIMRQYNTMRSVRRTYERQWYTNLSFYMGKQYVEWSKHEERLVPMPKLDKYTPRITVNKIRPIIRTEISKMTSQRPTASVMPASNDDDDVFAARAGEQVWASLYDRLNFDRVLGTAAFWASIAGNSYIKTFWDDQGYDANNKMYGDIGWAALSPFNILVPDLIEECLEYQSYVFCVYSKPIEWIELAYADVIPEGVNIASSGDVEDLLSPMKMGITPNTNARPPSALIIEAWVKPGATKLMPQGGFVTIVNNQIIQAGLKGIPYPHGEYPFAKIDHVPTGRYYTESVITDLIPLQIEYNRTQSQIIEAKNRTSKPQMIFDEGSVTPQKITTEPGLWIPIRPNAQRPQPIPLQDLPAYVVQFNERQQQNFEDISGQHEVSRGQAPGGVSAATAIAYLQERDDTYLSTTIRSIESAVETVARQSLSLAAAYWDVPRLVKSTGEDGGYEAALFKGADIARGCDLRVEAGSALPSSKSARMANVMDFMKFGYMSPQEGFELLDMPMLQQWTTRRGIDKRAAQSENIEFKRIPQEQIMMAEQMYQMQVQAGQAQIDPNTGMPAPRPSVIPINEWDNDDVHIEIHELMQKGSSYKLLPQHVRDELENHVAQHKARRMARMMGAMPPGGPQPGGAYEPGSQGIPGDASSGGMPPEGSPPGPGMTDMQAPPGSAPMA
jgi:hypothetical protein